MKLENPIGVMLLLIIPHEYLSWDSRHSFIIRFNRDYEKQKQNHVRFDYDWLLWKEIFIVFFPHLLILFQDIFINLKINRYRQINLNCAQRNRVGFYKKFSFSVIILVWKYWRGGEISHDFQLSFEAVISRHVLKKS